MTRGSTRSVQVTTPSPAPRAGWRGALDRFAGPGATRAELVLQFSVAVAAAAGASIYAHLAVGWSWGGCLLVGLLALDIAGGIATNATASAKRWYHRPGITRKGHLVFVALHAIQLALVAAVFRAMDWSFFAVYYAILLAGSVLLLLVPHYLQRPTGYLLLGGIILVDLYAVDSRARVVRPSLLPQALREPSSCGQPVFPRTGGDVMNAAGRLRGTKAKLAPCPFSPSRPATLALAAPSSSNRRTS